MVQTDISGMIGKIGSDAEHEMFSFDQVACLFWQGVYDLLRSRGKTHEQAIEWLQSRDARYMLDQFGDCIETLGYRLTETFLYPGFQTS